MNPPKDPTKLADNTHAYHQGKARYGLELTCGDLYDMVQAIEAGIGVLLYRRRAESGEWGAAYAIPFAGLLLPVAVIEHAITGLIVATILPQQVYKRDLTPRTEKKLDKLQAKIDALKLEAQKT